MSAVRGLAVAMVLAVLMGLLWLPAAVIGMVAAGEESRPDPASDSCGVAAVDGAYGETSVTVGSLTEQQVRSAHTIWTVAHQVGVGDRGALVGIATAMQESTMGANPSTKRPNSDVDVGLFQQRAKVGWYANGLTVEENVRILNDDAYAARTFFEGHVVTAEAHAAASDPAGPVGYRVPGLKQIRGWETMPVTVAAQAVQRSAYPTLYAKHEPLARQLVAGFNAEGAPPEAAVVGPVLCDPPAGPVGECPPTGMNVERGLTPDGLRVVRCAKAEFPEIQTMYGVRADSMPYHPSGRAIDIMLPGTCNPLGERVAAWVKDHADELGLDHVIWCQKIWTPARAGEGWRLMGDRGSATANHMDHVHVAVKGNAARSAAAAPSAGGAVVAPLEKYTLSARHNQAGSWWSSGFHTGLDFAGPVNGAPIRAVKAGTCTGSVWHSAYGNLLKVDHGGGIESWYAHMQAPATCSGRVEAGHVVGRVGTTGNSSGPHLHLEIRKGGSPVDPDAWLAANGVVLNGSRAGSRS